jgi:hypothetical protein
MRTQTYLRILPLLAIAGASVTLFGCSSSSTPATTPEVDSGTVDTGAKDTGTKDTAVGDVVVPPSTCPAALPSGYACPAPKTPATGTTCTTADVQGYYDACVGTAATDAKCMAFKASVASCLTCLDAGWIRPDGLANSPACFLTVDPTATDCAKVDECDDDCTNLTCWNTGTCSDSTAAQACNDQVTGAGGACAPLVDQTKLAACRNRAEFVPCDWTGFASDADYVKFLQGACQFGGKWSTTGGDAGTDAAGGETSTDAAGSDAGTDAASGG